MQTNDFSLLPITVFHAARVVDLPFHHHDPFDRLIIAQSLVEGVPVVSSDDTFDRMAWSEFGEKRHGEFGSFRLVSRTMATNSSFHENIYTFPFGLSLSKANNGGVITVRQAHRER